MAEAAPEKKKFGKGSRLVPHSSTKVSYGSFVSNALILMATFREKPSTQQMTLLSQGAYASLFALPASEKVYLLERYKHGISALLDMLTSLKVLM